MLQIFQSAKLVTWIWGEAPSSFIYHLQVWIIKCWVKGVACLIFWLFAMTSPIWLDSTMNYTKGGLNQPQINCGWFNQIKVLTANWINQAGLIQPWTREKAAWINHRSTAVDSTRRRYPPWLDQTGLIQPSTREKRRLESTTNQPRLIQPSTAVDLQSSGDQPRLIQVEKGTHRKLNQWPKSTTFLVDSSGNQQPSWLVRRNTKCDFAVLRDTSEAMFVDAG